MKKLILAVLFCIVAITSYSQKITNLVLLTADGKETVDPKSTASFVIIKKYSDTLFERLDYKINAPLTKVRHYKNEALKVLHGTYYEYAANGSVAVVGNYANNKKEGSWRMLNDTGKTVNEVIYLSDSIIEVIDVDKEPDTTSSGDEKEAEYPGNSGAWMKYLVKKLTKDNATEKSLKGGNVIVNFMISAKGKVEEAYISKSAEYILDESALEIVRASPKWNPAFQNGRNVNAYRRQPFTFTKQ